MRFETHRASAYLIEKLKAAGVHILHDGGDIILIETSGVKMSIHLIESFLPLYEIKTILSQHNKEEIYTLFIFWSESLLPHDGQWYEPDDWMRVVLSLYGDQMYGYEMYGSDVFFYPVYFKETKEGHKVSYGATIEAVFLDFALREITLPELPGYWRVANFTKEPSENWWRKTQESHKQQTIPTAVRLTQYYTLLGVPQTADRATIKRAYRVLARKYHPDLNSSPESTDIMQQINEAYAYILLKLDTETK